MPYLNYCSSAWASATQGRLGKLEKRLKNVHSFLEKESSFCLKDLLNKNDAILVFKAMNHIAPEYMCSIFMLAKSSHSHIELEEGIIYLLNLDPDPEPLKYRTSKKPDPINTGPYRKSGPYKSLKYYPG